MSKLAEILKRYGPLTSNEFASKLRKLHYANSDSTARKQIQRAQQKQEVLSTYPVQFGTQLLYFLEDHLKEKYAIAIRKLLPSKPSFYRVFKGLIANQGYITEPQIANFSGCVIDEPVTKKVNLKRTIEQLQKLKIIESVGREIPVFQIGSVFGSPKIKIGNFIRKLDAEQALLAEFSDWARSVYLIGWDSIETREHYTDTLKFNRMNWDIHGISYIGPFTKSTEVLSKARMKSAFVLAEILGFRAFSENDADAFLERIKNITLVWKTIHIIPIVLAFGYSKAAFKRLKSNGIAALTLKEVWGRKVQELLNIYNKILSDDDSLDIESIEYGLKIADTFSPSEGILGNLKGDFFEIMTALAYRSQGYDIVLQKIIRDPITFDEFEIDLVAIRGEQECLLIEAKGHHRDYAEEKDLLERHFSDRCRAAANESGWNVVNRYKEIKAIYFTTGTLSAEAKNYADKVKKSYHIDCEVVTRDGVIKLFERCDKRLKELIVRYY